MATPMHNANGHRRRELVKRVKAEERTCALCDQPVDKTQRGCLAACPHPNTATTANT
jgi:hypothetical protein